MGLWRLAQRLAHRARSWRPGFPSPNNVGRAAPRPDDELRLAMSPARNRLIRQGVINHLAVGAVIAVCAPAGLLLLARFRPVMDLWFWCGLVALASLAGAVAVALGRRPGWGSVAGAIDATGLAERTVTALWSAYPGRTAPTSETAQAFIAAERSDALRRLKAFDPVKGIPLSWPTRIWRSLAAGLVAVLILAVWPNPMAAVAGQREAVRKAIADQAKAVEKVKKDIQSKSADLPPKDAAELQKTLEELLKELKKAGPAEEALKALSKAQEKLGEQAATAERADAAGGGRALADLASQMKGSQAGKAAGEKIAAGDPAGAKEELSKLADAAAGMSEGDRRDLAGALDRAAQSGSGQGQVAKAAGQAAKDLAANEGSGAAGSSLQALNSAVQAAMGSAAAGTAIAGAQSALQSSQAAVVTAGQSASSVAQGNSGQSGQSGTGSGSSGAGSGSTNSDAGQGNQAPNQPGSTNPSGASGNKTGSYERLYDPSRLGGDGQTSVVGGKTGDGASETVDSEQHAAGPGSLRPYDEIYSAYNQEAMTAIDSAYVPASLRDLIRQYFSSLDPGAGQ
ncbi:MAG: hypothetical protein ACYC6V_09430 [Bacillota bacterium]